MINFIVLGIISLFGILLGSIAPFLDKLPLHILSSMDYIILKLLVIFIPLIFIILFLCIKGKHKDIYNTINYKIVIVCILATLLSLSIPLLLLILIKHYEVGIVIPFIFSLFIIFSFLINSYVYKRKIKLLDCICIILIVLSLFYLSRYQFDKNKNEEFVNHLVKYLD